MTSRSTSSRARRAASVATALAVGAAVLTAPSASASTAETVGNTITGSVQLADGTPVPYSDVVVHAVPLADELNDLPLVELARTTTDDAGNYVLTVPAASVGALQTLPYVVFNNGELNLQVRATSLFAPADMALSDVEATQAGEIFAAAQETPVDADLRQAQDLQGLAFAGLVMEPLKVANDTSGAVDPSLDRVARALGAEYCGYSEHLINSNAYPVVVGEAHAYYDITVKYTYTSMANSTLGVYYSPTGTGNWTANGSVKVRNSSSFGAASAYQGPYFGRHMLAQFTLNRYKWYRGECYGPAASGYIVRSGPWTGGMSNGLDVSQYDGYEGYNNAQARGWVAQVQRGGSAYKTGTRGYTYDFAAGAYGAKIAATTEYDTSHRLDWTAGTGPYSHDLFGNDGPPSTARLVYSF